MLIDSAEFPCPWCGETNTLELDPAEAGQVIVVDCAVCCAPIEIERGEIEGGPTPDEPLRVRREGG